MAWTVEGSSIARNRFLTCAGASASTRAASVDLARRLHPRPPSDDLTIAHNSLGPLTAKAWLRYLIHHADLESRKLRGAPTPQTGGMNAAQTQPSATKL